MTTKQKHRHEQPNWISETTARSFYIHMMWRASSISSVHLCQLGQALIHGRTTEPGQHGPYDAFGIVTINRILTCHFWGVINTASIASSKNVPVFGTETDFYVGGHVFRRLKDKQRSHIFRALSDSPLFRVHLRSPQTDKNCVRLGCAE